MNEEKEARTPVSDQKRTALLRYMMILFAVAFLLVLLSYLIQVFNSQSTISQLNATSASALQNAERLQDTNRELTEENERLQDEIDALNEKNESQAKAAETDRETAREEGRTEGEQTGREAGMTEAQKAYDLLLQAVTAADDAERAKALDTLSGMEDLLSEKARKQYEALKAPAQTAETDEPNESDNE